MTWSTRFFTARLDAFFDQANEALTSKAEREYADAADRVADWWGARIAASGRGGSHNAQMANIESKVTKPRRGGFFVRVGWLNNPPMAADGKTSWFVYQDTGYDLFGRGRMFIEGLMLQIDARQMLRSELEDANDRIAREIRRAAARQRRR